jgi:hypothetical protein
MVEVEALGLQSCVCVVEVFSGVVAIGIVTIVEWLCCTTLVSMTISFHLLTTLERQVSSLCSM